LKIAFFIPSNAFLGVVKLHVFGKKILGTIGDAINHILSTLNRTLNNQKEKRKKLRSLFSYMSKREEKKSRISCLEHGVISEIFLGD
jgi:hypothetical protein